MLRRFVVPIFAIMSWNGAAFAQPSVNDDFEKSRLDWLVWCPCQINLENSPVTFLVDHDQPGDRIARITADDSSLGGNKCRYKAPHAECRPPPDSAMFGLVAEEELIDEIPDLPEPLGPSLVRPLGPEAMFITPKNPYCTEDVLRRAIAAGEEDLCIQRQELRFQKSSRHDAREPMLYSLKFRMPEAIEDRTNSIRWVTAQWKHTPISIDYCREFDCNEWGPSPFLAQRFDDGVLYVTVQDEHCRCAVASAPLPDGSNRIWTDGPAQYCASTRPSTGGKVCIPNLQVEYGTNPVLSTALGEWVEMRYRVQAGRANDAIIEVHEGDRFIVRVIGKIGYEPRRGTSTIMKFKVGMQTLPPAPLPDGSNRIWTDGPAQYCASTRPSTGGKVCIPNLQVEYGTNPVLSTALGEWVEMRYRVQAGRANDAIIEVHEGDRFIVRVIGKIGYEPRRGTSTIMKFKVGMYRDYMPFVHSMDIDWLTLEPAED